MGLQLPKSDKIILIFLANILKILLKMLHILELKLKNRDGIIFKFSKHLIGAFKIEMPILLI